MGGSRIGCDRAVAAAGSMLIGMVALLLGGAPLLGQATNPASASPLPPDPARPESAFDFMLGEWTTVGQVLSDDGTAPADHGRSTVTRAFAAQPVSIEARSRQCTLEQADDSAFGLTEFEALDVFVFHDESQEWRGMNINSLANRKWIRVEIAEGELVLLHEGELFGEAEGIVRFTYYDIGPESYQMRVDHSPDGVTWDMGTYEQSATRTAGAGCARSGI